MLLAPTSVGLRLAHVAREPGAGAYALALSGRCRGRCDCNVNYVDHDIDAHP